MADLQASYNYLLCGLLQMLLKGFLVILNISIKVNHNQIFWNYFII